MCRNSGNKCLWLVITALFYSLTVLANTPGNTVSSPDKKIVVRCWVDTDSRAYYTISCNGELLLQKSKLGVIREDEDFSNGLSISKIFATETVTDHYTIQKGKRAHCSYIGNKKVFLLQTAAGKMMQIIFQVSNDGVALRYYFPGASTGIKKIREEITSFHFTAGTKGWLQPMSEAKSGWSKVNPCYEEYYAAGIPAGTPSPTKAGWVFPALFQPGNHWVLITETAVNEQFCASRLRSESPSGEYSIGYPDSLEAFPGGPFLPQSGLPWYTPWRIITIGSLATITESTLGTDLATPAVKMDESFIRPGKASWSWALLKDGSVTYDVQKQFIDYAADMHWQYCLVDVNWDTRIGYDKMKELADYAGKKNIGLILWYNSSGDWNTTVYTPKSKLLTHADRVKEFSRLQQMGIKGIKVDFFGGDGQSMIQYYIDILLDAAQYHLLVNFHGATLPRGWQRTYPNLVTMEAVKGFEYVTFEQKNADEEPVHCTILPFARNAFDPMDFTPMCLYEIPKIQRRTTCAFELALPVIFLSGIQHFAETPAGMEHMPVFIKDFLRALPTYWDNTKFIDGYPGKLVVIARQSKTTWYVGGINGENIEKKIPVNLSSLKIKKAILITDGVDGTLFSQQSITIPADGKIWVDMKAHGGFVIISGF